jgi:hypothetical protein
MYSLAGGLDEIAPSLFAVDLPAGGTAVDGGSLAVRRRRGPGVVFFRKSGAGDVHDTQRIRYAGYQ